MVLLLLFSSILSMAQSELENHEKYWLYRHQLRERYMKVGTNPGESLPASVILPNNLYGQDSEYKAMHWRDGTISLGHYFIVLATEYRLLLEHGQETTTTENELYYALKAAIRLDQYCEHFTTGGVYGTDPGFINGLMMRDDVPANFYQHWSDYQNEYPYTPSDDYPAIKVRSDFSIFESTGENATALPFNDKNVQSIDQVVSMLLGLRFVLQLVDNIDVQPTTAEEPLNIHQTARDIIWRLVARMNDTGTAGSPHEWVIKEENGELVPRGNNAAMASYPLIELLRFTHGDQVANFIESPGKIILQISKKDYCESPADTWVNAETLGGALGMTAGNIIGPFIGAPFAGYDIALYNFINCNGTMNELPIEGPMPIRLDIDDIQELWHDLNDSYSLVTVGQTEPLVIFNTDFDFELQNILNTWVSYQVPQFLFHIDPQDYPKAFDQVNIHLLYELATLGGLWDSNYLTFNSQISNMPANGLMNAVLHDNRALPINYNLSQLTNMLDCAPAEGIWADQFSLNAGCSLMSSPNMLFLPDDAQFGPQNNGIVDAEYRGEYPGIDYMVLYNLYRLVHEVPEEIGYEYRPACQCRNVLPVEPVESGVVEVNPQFEDYFERQLPIETFINSSFQLTGPDAVLQVNNDLIICSRDGSPLEVLLDNQAKMNIAPGRTVSIRNNCTLRLNAAQLNVLAGNNNGKMTSFIVEEGGQFIIESDGQLVLDQSIHIENLGGFIRFENTDIFNNNYSNRLNYHTSKQADMHWISVSCDLPIEMTTSAIEQSTLLFQNSNLALHLRGILDQQTGMYVYDSDIRTEGGTLNFSNSSFAIVQNSQLELSNTEWTFGLSSDLQTNLALIKVNDGSILTFKGNTANGISNWVFDQSSFELNSNESKIVLDGGGLFVAENSTFQNLFPSGETGVFHIQGSLPTDIVLEHNAQFILQGDNPSEVLLELSPNHALRFLGFKALVELRSGVAIVPQLASIRTNSSTNFKNVLFQNPVINDAQVWCFNGPLNVTNTTFENVGLRAQHSKTNIQSSNFSGPFSRMFQNFGSFGCSQTNFTNSELHLHMLNTSATVSKCIFNNNLPNVYQAIGDNSQVELYLSENQFTGYLEAISKSFGKLSMRCNYVSNNSIGVLAHKCLVNLSSSSNAGFNQFENNETHLYCNQINDLLLRRGFNQFGSFATSCIEGTILKACDLNCNQATIPASNNQWWASPSNGMHLETTGFLSSCNGQTCPVTFNDPSSSFAVVCPSSKPVLKPRSSSASSELENVGGSRTNTDLVHLPGFGEMPLDSALSIAAMHTEIYDSLANDAEAIDLFHHILSSGVDLTSLENRKRMEWGVDYMKTALENMFAQNEISPADNRQSFSSEVEKYVDVLNFLTTTQVADSLVSTQFYLELNKGHLFRLIEKPEMALSIYNNLLDCPLDSTEMNSLQHWISQIEVELAIVESYFEGESVTPEDLDSPTSNESPSIAEEQYRFGVYIHSPNAVSFIDCALMEFMRGREYSGLIYPNPANTELNIQVQLTENETPLVIVYDMFGKTVYQQNSIQKLDVSNWPSGVYALHFSSEKQELKQLFVIEH